MSRGEGGETAPRRGVSGSSGRRIAWFQREAGASRVCRVMSAGGVSHIIGRQGSSRQAVGSEAVGGGSKAVVGQ
jgi:hypothetical protein